MAFTAGVVVRPPRSSIFVPSPIDPHLSTSLPYGDGLPFRGLIVAETEDRRKLDLRLFSAIVLDHRASAIATHQQNGQHCGSENGESGDQKPPLIGTAVKSTFQTWFS